MATELLPDLSAAAAAAWRLQDDHQHGAAYHLIPQFVTGRDGTRYEVTPHPDVAVEHAWAALAAKYEAKALIAGLGYWPGAGRELTPEDRSGGGQE